MTRDEILAALKSARETYAEMLKNPIESYRFDSGEGSQQTKYRTLKEVKDAIRELESELADIEGKGIVTFGTRRY